jgi:hypothetical protein
MLYLIGVNHIVQFDPAPDLSKTVREKRASFKAHVSEIIEKLDISILAEEFSDEAKKKWGASESTLEQLGKAKRIEHRFCDATISERKENEIEESDSDKREQFWLSRIQDCKNSNVLFVCGDDHCESFGKKLPAAGCDVKHGPRWCISKDEWNIIAKERWAAS